MRRSTRQQSKPVIIDLVLTESGGYELFDDRMASMVAAQKAMIQKVEKPLNYAKTMAPRSVEKIGTPPSSNFGMSNDMLMRSRTSVKPPMMPSKISVQNGMPTGERMGAGRPMGPGGDTIRREIQSFSNYSLPPSGSRQGHEGGSHEGYNPSSFGHPGGSTLSALNSMVPPSGYMKAPEKPQKVFPVVIPSCSQWFDLDKIHEIEKEGLPEFFIGKPSKTPEIYKRYRSHIIQLYRQNIGNYLNASTCRKLLPGDACSIIRIHAFLERWGLINFHIDPANNPKTLFFNRANFTHERLIEASQTDSKMEVFDKLKKGDLSESDQKEIIDQLKKLDRNSRPVCDFCGIRCGMSWYYQKGPEPSKPEIEIEGTIPQENPENGEKKSVYKGKRMILCTRCYSEQNFPKLLTSTDFFKIDPSNVAGSTKVGMQLMSNWIHEDTYRLLDLIQKCGENWNEIQKNLPHKTKAEIIAHYLQLPLNNITPINILDMGELKGHEETTNERVSDLTPTVFGDFSNPILQHVAVYKSLLTKSREQAKKKKDEQERLIKQAADEQKKKEAEEAAAITAKIEEEKSEKEIVKIQEGEEGETAEMNIEKPEPEGEGEETAMKIEDEKPEEEVVVAEEKPEEEKPIEEKKEEVTEAEAETETEVKKEEEEVVVKKPEIPKTQEEITFDLVEDMVRSQVTKLDSKIDYLGEFEDMLVRERTQFDVLQQSLILDQIEFARKKLEAPKPTPTAAPQQQYGQNGPTANAALASTFENREAGYFDFNNANGTTNTFAGAEMADFGDGSFL
jgi:hypothetical protein